MPDAFGAPGGKVVNWLLSAWLGPFPAGLKPASQDQAVRFPGARAGADR
jgi:hypothetical protein